MFHLSLSNFFLNLCPLLKDADLEPFTLAKVRPVTIPASISNIDPASALAEERSVEHNKKKERRMVWSINSQMDGGVTVLFMICAAL